MAAQKTFTVRARTGMFTDPADKTRYYRETIWRGIEAKDKAEAILVVQGKYPKDSIMLQRKWSAAKK